MLLHRILTALVLIPLVIFGVLYLSTPWIALITGIIIVLGAWEWAGIISIEIIQQLRSVRMELLRNG